MRKAKVERMKDIDYVVSGWSCDRSLHARVTDGACAQSMASVCVGIK